MIPQQYRVHQFIIKKPMCYVGKAIYKTHGLHRRSTRDTINPGTGYTVYKNTGPQSTRITTSMAYDLQFERLWASVASRNSKTNDFCRAKHRCTSCAARADEEESRALKRALRGTNYYWGIPIGSQKTRNAQNIQADRLYTRDIKQAATVWIEVEVSSWLR